MGHALGGQRVKFNKKASDDSEIFDRLPVTISYTANGVKMDAATAMLTVDQVDNDLHELVGSALNQAGYNGGYLYERDLPEGVVTDLNIEIDHSEVLAKLIGKHNIDANVTISAKDVTDGFSVEIGNMKFPNLHIRDLLIETSDNWENASAVTFGVMDSLISQARGNHKVTYDIHKVKPKF